MAVLSWFDAVDIGFGRGRLAAPAAASLRRVDSAFGRAVDINEAWRSPEDANSNYAAYLWHLRGGPWAPIALPADKSVHCVGFAIDTDDDWAVAILNDHGWYQTVYRWVNGRYVLVEPWHFEYFPERDNHRHEGIPAGVGGVTFDPSTPIEEDDMFDEKAQRTLDAIANRAIQPIPTRIIRNATELGGDGNVVMLHPFGWEFVSGTDGSANGAALLAGQLDPDGDGIYWVDLSPDRFKWEMDRHKQMIAELDKRIRAAIAGTDE